MPEFPTLEIVQSKFESHKALDRVDAARIAHNYGDQFLNQLKDALSDSYYEVRAYACYSLGILKCTEFIDLIHSATTDEVEEVRYRAVEALGNVRHLSSIPFILMALGDSSRETVRLAIKSLEEYDPQVVEKSTRDILESLHSSDHQEENEVQEFRYEWIYSLFEAFPSINQVWKYDILIDYFDTSDLELVRLSAIAVTNAPQNILSFFGPKFVEFQTTVDDDLRLAVAAFFMELPLELFNDCTDESYIEYLQSYFTDPYEFIRGLAYKKFNSHIQETNQYENYSDEFVKEIIDDPSVYVQTSFAETLPINRHILVIAEKYFEKCLIDAKMTLLRNSYLLVCPEELKREYITKIEPIVFEIDDALLTIAFTKFRSGISSIE